MGIRRFAAGHGQAVLTAAVLITAPATALSHAIALVDGSEPQQILLAARLFGAADQIRDGLDDPLIRGQIDGKDYVVYFYGCDHGRDCTNLMFVARWKSDRFTDKSMGDWNRDKRFGKAYLDDNGNPSVELNVNLLHGVSRGNLEDTFDWWGLIMAEFADFFGL